MIKLRVFILLAAMTALPLTGCRQPAKPEPAGPGPVVTEPNEPRPTTEKPGVFDKIAPIVDKQIADGNIPGAVVLVGLNDDVLYLRAFGSSIIEPQNQPTTTDTIYDLASMTKPIATATAILILRDRGRIDPNDLVSLYLPAFAAAGKQDVRIRHLLTHTSGLPAYTNATAIEKLHGSPCRDAVIDKICSLKALSPPGETFRYSCLGYITLARIVEVAADRSFDEFCAENVFQPLQMTSTSFNPPDSWTPRIAATEVINGEPLRGTVHDPLARIAGGISGNAGLFSAAGDLSRYCRMLLHQGRLDGKAILSPESVELLTTPQSHGRAFGFDVNSAYAWIKGQYAGPDAFCHSGYTGTSIVCDPATGEYLLILTNRAHPADSGTTRPLRTQIANLVFRDDAPSASAE